MCYDLVGAAVWGPTDVESSLFYDENPIKSNFLASDALCSLTVQNMFKNNKIIIDW